MMISKVNRHRAVRVTDPASSVIRFTIFPFGKGYRGKPLLTTVGVKGDAVVDLITRRTSGHKTFISKIFGGANGSVLPSNLA